MKRFGFISLLGLVVAVGAFVALYAIRTAGYRRLEEQCGPELAWIKMEFQLSDADFERVRALHEAYKPECAARCREIDEQNRGLARLLATSHEVTPEIEKVLTRAAELRAQCQTEMLKHFFQVSHAMPPEQGRRYLAWMQAQTLAPTHESMLPQVRSQSAHDLHSHR